MKMFKRKLFKRALPIILSVAMIFETMPATALAAESQTVETSASDETAKPDISDDNTGNDAEGSEQNAEPADSADSAGKSGAEGGSTSQEADGLTQAEADTAQKEEGASSETVVTEPQETKPAESETPETKSAESEVAETQPAESETVKSETAESETVKPETETAEAETTEAEEVIEAAADGETPSQTEAETLVAKIVVEDKDFDEKITFTDNADNTLQYTFTRRLSEEGLDFFTTYIEKSGCGRFQEKIAEKLHIEVDGERIDELKDRLTYKWVKKASTEAEKDQILKDAVPIDAGKYELVISLDAAKIDGLYNKLEKDLVISLEIEKAEIALKFSAKIAPAKTAQDLIDEINEGYKIQYTANDTYEVSKEILKITDGKLPIHLFVIDESGKRQPMKETDQFDRTKDYELTIDELALTEQAGKNYKLSVKAVYPVVVGERQATEIQYELKNPGSALIEQYDPEKEWKIEEVTKDLFTEPVKEGETVTKPGGAPTVFIEDEDGNFDTVLEGAVLAAKWYTRIQVGADPEHSYEVDEESGEIADEDEDFVYKPMSSDPKDAGEYFIIWSYAGDNNSYTGTHSDPLKFTIDPVPVVIKTSEESVAAANFHDGMDYKDIQKALAAISYGVYPKVKNETTGAMEISAKALEITPDFFGTSYGISDEDKTRTQYFVPEFVLQRRVKTITEKGQAPVAVDARKVDWTAANEDWSINGVWLYTVVKEEFDNISSELPKEYQSEAARKQLESVTFEYRVYFTGNKVVYDKEGNLLNKPSDDYDESGKYRVPVTDVTTNAANRNYLADITKAALEENAVEVSFEQIKTETAQIVTDGIVDAFIADNKEMLDPQIPDKSTPEAARALHAGTLEQPAVKIYDQNALFKDRASYKKAKVHKLNEQGALGEALPVESTDDVLEYRWSFTTLENYEAYLEKWDEEQREYADFNDFYIKNDLGMTNVDDGTLDSFKGAGLYRLTVTYKNPKNAYRAEKAELFFKVERQEIIIVPSEQYVKDGKAVSEWKENAKKQKTEINRDFTIYKLPHNSIDSFNQLTDEKKKDYVLPTAEELAADEQKTGAKPDLTLDGVTWEVLRKERNPETGEVLEPAKWIEAGEEAQGKFNTDFTYGVAVHWKGKDNGPKFIVGDDYNNYTTLDVKTFRATGEEKHYESVSAARFYDQQLYVEVDADKIRALSHEYNGEAVDVKKVAEALTFYTDEMLTKPMELPVENIVNTSDKYNPNKINIYWDKIDKDENRDNITYANKDAVYGGTYELVLRFEGGELSTAADKPETAQEDAAVQTYAPISDTGWIGFQNAVLSITPREITITPAIMKAETLFAGQTADQLLSEGITVQNLIEKDKKFFTYAEIADGGFDTCWFEKEDGTDGERSAYQYKIDKDGGYPAFNAKADYIIQVDGRAIETEPENVYLRTNSTYTVKLSNELAQPLRESYKVQYGTAEVQVTQRGSAEISEIRNDEDGVESESALCAKGISYELNDSIYTIRPRGAVKFYYEDESLEVIDRDDNSIVIKNTNVLGFRIYAPKEFAHTGLQQNFIYKNAVWNAGGYFYNSADWQESENENDIYIDVVFPLTKEDMERSFNITWEEGYTESFTLSGLALEEDLRKAVAPKSIKFNGVAGKMAVGETQQLDVKITKTQLGDVINIRYHIKGGETKNEYISIDPETGIVTALKAGKTATAVEAYPVYKDAKGNFVPVLDQKGKEAKAATAKITVTEVTAPAVKKITAKDTEASVYFTVPDDGYRREIYVVDVTKDTEYADRKKWKPADFNNAIAEVRNGQLKNAGFEIVQYSTAKNEDLDSLEAKDVYDKKLKAHIAKVTGLKAGHEYTVYVRNVSAARALDDGSVVVLSANGTVKNFKMTKPMAENLELDFPIKADENDKKNTVTHPVKPDGTIDMTQYTVELSAKKAQLNVYGLFPDKEGGNNAAEDKDQRRYSLIPTVKEEKAALKNYQLPKLAFAVYDDQESKPFEPGLTPSKYASISNKGLITLKGVGLNGKTTVYIYVRDILKHEGKSDYRHDAMICLTITAKPASFAGKKVKMKVGQEIKLSDYLEYKDDKKKKLPNYRSGSATITKETIAMAEASGYKIEDKGEWVDVGYPNNRIEVHDWRITAVAPNKTPFDLTVTDYDAEGNEMTASVKLSSAQIDPVKGMKVTYVDDQYITINFTHPSNLNEEDTGSVYAYALEVKDARGNVVDKVILDNPKTVENIDGVNAKELKNAQSWIQYKTTVITEEDGRKYLKIETNDVENEQSLTQVKLDDQYRNSFNYYTGEKTKTKTFAYTYHNSKLVRLSSYTLSLTPLYENQQAAKAATAKAKTTNIPASRDNVDLTGADYTDRHGGNWIDITSKQFQETKEGSKQEPVLKTYRFISGNTYTLKLQDSFGELPRDRVSDTLTWKSSNPKTATIKANAGTYTATLKAVNQGKTTITVTSKVTKKVIARWSVSVSAVGDGSSYGGDYEPTWDEGFYEKILALLDPFYNGKLEVLSESVPLEIKKGRTWISFTAPHYGKYFFTHTGLVEGEIFHLPIVHFYDSKNGKEIVDNTDSESIYLQANQKVYFVVSGETTVNVKGEELARLTKEHTKTAPLEVKEGNVAFTAWEDNWYTIYHNGKILQENRNGKWEDLPMHAGETKYIPVQEGKMYVICEAVSLELGSTPSRTVKLDKDNQKESVRFTANVDGTYKFTYDKRDGVGVVFKHLTKGSVKPVSTTKSTGADAKITETYQLRAGETIGAFLRPNPEITDAKKEFDITISVEAEPRRKIENSAITIPKGTTEIVEYVIPAFTTETAQFSFAVTGEEGTKITAYYDKKYNLVAEYPSGVSSFDLSAGKKNSRFKAGDSIFIKVEAGAGKAGDEKAKDAVLTVKQVPVTTLTGSSEISIDNQTRQWYTFTAPQTGFYEFGVTVAAREQGDQTPTHQAAIKFYKSLFDAEENSLGEIDTSQTKIVSMKAGQTVALRLSHDEQENITKEDGTIEPVKSSVTVSVKALEVKPLSVNKGEKVELPAKSKEARYYSFTAAVESTYTRVWEPEDNKTDNAKVTMLSSIESGASADEKAVSVELKADEVRYIKVEIDKPTSDNPVNGTLTVKAEGLKADNLTANEAYPFHLTAKDSNSTSKVVRFTAPVEGKYAFTTTVEKNELSGLPYEYPDITILDSEDVFEPYEEIDLKKGETKYFALSIKKSSEVRETKGTIMITSRAKPIEQDTEEIKVSADTPKTFKYIIPVSGRYEFKAEFDEDIASVTWSDSNNVNVSVNDGNYYKKNTELTVEVEGFYEDITADVKLHKPSLITTTPLNAGGNKLELNAGETKYYELSTTAARRYSFEITDLANGTSMPEIYTVFGKTANNWSELKDGGLRGMAKDSSLILKVISPRSSKKGVSCSLNITENTELKLGDNTVTIDAGVSVTMTYRALETGYYTFNVNQPDAQLVLRIESTTWVGSSFYNCAKFMVKGVRDYTITNEGSSAVTLTVTMKEIEPVVLEPGKDEPKAKDVALGAGEYAFFLLKSFKESDYRIKITDTSKGEDLNVYLDSQQDFSQYKTAEGYIIDQELSGEKMLTISNDGIKETKVTVEFTISEVQPLTADPITLGKNEIRKFSYLATEDTRYLISRDNDDKNLKLDLSVKKIDSNGNITEEKKDAPNWYEILLKKGDKLIGTLSYKPDAQDEKAKDTQTVTIVAAPVQPVIIDAEAIPENETSKTVKLEPVTIGEKDNSSRWYQFKAAENATYHFALTDAYGNEISNAIEIYNYITDEDEAASTNTERYMKAGSKLFINVKNTGTYTFQYTATKALTQTGVEVLDFEYQNEVQEVKFVVPRGGIYNISATPIRGNFDVDAKIGEESAFEDGSSFSTFHDKNKKTRYVNQDDVVTIKVMAQQSGKASLSLRIDEVSTAAALALDKEIVGTGSSDKDSYYEFRAKKKGLYAITASGEPDITYSVIPFMNAGDGEQQDKEVTGTAYEELNAGDRIAVKVAKGTEKEYTLKIEMITIVSLDGSNTEQKPFEVTAADGFYGFTTEKAYVQYKVPEDGQYYIAVQTINSNTDVYGPYWSSPSETARNTASLYDCTKDDIATFILTNTNPKDDKNPAKEYQEAQFRLIVRKTIDATIKVDETKEEKLDSEEKASYKFTAPEAGTYLISFKASNCTLENFTLENDIKEWKLEKDQEITLTVINKSDKAGRYRLTVTKLNPTALTLGQTAEGLLEKGKTAYYQFTSTEAERTGYQVYISGTDVQCNVERINSEGVSLDSDPLTGNQNYDLMKDEKLVLKVTNTGEKNTGFKVTVKKIAYAALNAETPVSGDLEAYEKAYYEFTEGVSETGITYLVDLDSENSQVKQSIQIAKLGADDELGAFEDQTDTEEVTLKKGDKLRVEVYNGSSKNAEFELTVKNTAEPEISYEAIALNETKAGKLTAEQKAGYEFTASDAADDGTAYTIFFSGTECAYQRIRTVTGDDGSTKEEVQNGKLEKGSNELSLKKGDKVRFTVSGIGKYELTVKKVVYLPLTLDKTATKTLRENETIYYEFTDTTTEDKKKTTYHVFGSEKYEVAKVTLNEDQSTTVTPITKASEYELQKGESLRFKVTNDETALTTIYLTIQAVVYSTMTLDTPVEGRLSAGRYAYYQFTSQDDPAEGETETTYHIYGSAEYKVSKVTVNDDQSTTTTPLEKNTTEVRLKKGDSLQFTVTGSSNWKEGYSLTITKYAEKPITIGTTERGSLAYKQEFVYTYEHKSEEPAKYILRSEVENLTLTSNVAGAVVREQEPFEMKKGEKLVITITNSSGENNSYEFTVNEFKPETLTPGVPTALRTLEDQEKVYYEYTVPEGGNGSYVLVLTESKSGAFDLDGGITRANPSEDEDPEYPISGVINEMSLKKDDVLWFTVDATEKASYRLLLQKMTDFKDQTELPWKGQLQPGEVKYFKFVMSEQDKKDKAEYIISVPFTSDNLHCSIGGNIDLTPSETKPVYWEISDNYMLTVVNTSMYETVECKIDVQKKEQIAMGTHTGTLAPKEYQYLVFPGNVVETKDEVTGEIKEKVTPYYISISDENECKFEWQTREEMDLWEPLDTGMGKKNTNYIVRVGNTGSKTSKYEFTLKDAMGAAITAPEEKKGTLGKNEAAYYTITAPENQAFYISVNSEASASVYCSQNLKELLDDRGTEIESGEMFGVPAGKTYYVKTANADTECEYILRVTEASVIPLELNTASTKVYIPANAKAEYEFTAPKNGNYIVLVDGSISWYGSHQFTYADGTENISFENGHVFRGLTANNPLRLSIANEGFGNQSCIVRIVEAQETPDQEIEPGESKNVVLTDANRTATYTFKAPEAGRYVFNTETEPFKDPVTIQVAVAEQSRTINYEKMYITPRLSEGDVTEFTLSKWDLPDMFTLSCFRLTDEREKTGVMKDTIKLSQGEAAYVRWNADTEGKYQFGFDAGQSEVAYWYSSSETFETDLDFGTASSMQWNRYGNIGRYKYLILKATEDDTEITINAAALPPTMLELNEETTVLLKQGEPEYVTFKATGDRTRYKFTTGNPDVEFYDSNYSYMGVTFEKVLSKEDGEQYYYLEYTGDNAETETHIRVSSVEPEPIYNGQYFIVGAYDVAWYEFTPYWPAIYTFGVEQDSSPADFTLYTSMTGTSLTKNSYWLEEHEKLLIRIENDSPIDKEYWFTAIDKPPVHEEVITLEEGKKRTISFTAPETGTYTYVAYTTDRGRFQVNYEDGESFVVQEGNDKDHEMRRNGSKWFMEGDTVELELVSESEGPHTIGIRVEPQKTAVKITNAQENIYPLAYDENYFVYTAEKDEYYMIEASGGYRRLLYKINSANDWLNCMDIQMIKLNKDDKLLLRVIADSISTLNLKISEAEFMQISAEEPETPYVLAGSENVYYQFTAPEAGQYVVNLKRKNSSSVYAYPEVNGDFDRSSFYGIKEFELAKDEKLLLRVHNSSYNNAEYTLTAKKIVYQPLSLEEQTTPYSLAKGDVAYYQFTAEEAGVYAVNAITESDSNSPSYYYLDENGKYTSWSDIRPFELQKDDSFILKAIAFSDDAQYKLAVNKFEVNEVTLNTPVSKELEAQKDTFFRFTASSADWYVVSANLNNGTVYYALNKGYYNYANGQRGEAYLATGDALWLRVKSYSKQTVEVNAEMIEFSPITGGEETFTQRYETKYYQYEAESDGKYAINITGTSISGYYAEKNNTIFSYFYNERVFDLKRGESIRIKVLNNSSASEENPFTVSVKEVDETNTN